MFHTLEPEVAGGFGDNSVLDTSSHPALVTKLHCELDGWLGDDLLESFPCYIVTERLRSVIEKTEATGCSFDVVEVTMSEQFYDMYPNRRIPRFFWLKATGTPGTDDFGVSTSNCLVVSDRVFQVMATKSQLTNCEAEVFEA